MGPGVFPPGIATAHMADHSVGAALYALKALKLARQYVDRENEWQLGQLEALGIELRDLIRETMREKGARLGI